jgi:hypothetical protein
MANQSERQRRIRFHKQENDFVTWSFSEESIFEDEISEIE